MADNVGYTPGTGALVAADEIAGVLHQRIKLGIGDDGVAVDVSTTNPMPITAPTPIDVQGTVAVTATTPINVTGTVNVGNFPAVQVVSDPTADDTRQDMVLLLTRMLNYLNAPQGYDKSSQRGRVTAVVESGTVTTVTTVTTCATVTNLSTIDTLQGRIQVYGANLSAWADCVRSRIT
jgi:hypothetical protein